MEEDRPTVRDILIDPEDRHLLHEHTWHIDRRGNTFYARARIGGKLVYLHKVICPVPPPLEVDHDDGNGLNNRRSNLRPATKGQNGRNRHHQKRGRTLPVGVYPNKQRFCARATIDRHVYLLGTHDTPELAAEARARFLASRDL